MRRPVAAPCPRPCHAGRRERYVGSIPAASINGLGKPFLGPVDRNGLSRSARRPCGGRACQRLHRALQVAQVVVPIDRGGGRRVGLPECLRRRTEVRIRRSPWRKRVGHGACSVRSSSPCRRAPPRRHAGTTCPAREGIASVSPSTDQRSGFRRLTAHRHAQRARSAAQTYATYQRPRTRLRHVGQPFLAQEATSRPRLLEDRDG